MKKKVMEEYLVNKFKKRGFSIYNIVDRLYIRKGEDEISILFKNFEEMNEYLEIHLKEKSLDNKMYNEEETQKILNEKFDILNNYCQFLAKKYNETLDGSYRIIYNDLYAFLYNPIPIEKKMELLNKLPIKIENNTIYF